MLKNEININYISNNIWQKFFEYLANSGSQKLSIDNKLSDKDEVSINFHQNILDKKSILINIKEFLTYDSCKDKANAIYQDYLQLKKYKNANENFLIKKFNDNSFGINNFSMIEKLNLHNESTPPPENNPDLIEKISLIMHITCNKIFQIKQVISHNQLNLKEYLLIICKKYPHNILQILHNFINNLIIFTIQLSKSLLLQPRSNIHGLQTTSITNNKSLTR